MKGAKVVDMTGRVRARDAAELHSLLALYHEAEAAMHRAIAEGLRQDRKPGAPKGAA